jgi:hypothetical protein
MLSLMRRPASDLGPVAELLGLGRQVIRIDADAVAAHEARFERQEVPLGAAAARTSAVWFTR